MAIDFPNTPTANQTYTVGNRTWKYDGEKWVIISQADNASNQIYDITVLMKMETF